MAKRYLSVGATGLAVYFLSSLAVAGAAEVSVGGVSASIDGGSVSVGAGDTTASVSLGGGGGSVAAAGVSTGSDSVNVSIGTGSGPLASVNQNGTPLGGGSRTGVSINLGGALGVLPGVSPNVTLPNLRAAVAAGGGGADVAAMQRRCRSILRNPGAYENDLVALCALLRRL